MAETSYVYAGTVHSAAGGSGGIFRQTAGEQRWEALTNGLPDETQVHAITVHPANGIEAKSSAVTVEAGKMRVIGATFGTDLLPQAQYDTVVICPAINFFDSKGQPVLAVCEGWQSSSSPMGGTVSGPAAAGAPARLLPVASGGR